MAGSGRLDVPLRDSEAPQGVVVLLDGACRHVLLREPSASHQEYLLRREKLGTRCGGEDLTLLDAFPDLRTHFLDPAGEAGRHQSDPGLVRRDEARRP